MYRLSRAASVSCGAIPLLLLASPFACGQTATPAAASQTQSASTTAAAVQPSTKVWTNDDVGSLRTKSTLSTVGPTAANSKKAARATSPVAKGSPTTSYQSQLAKLRSQLPPIDSQIAELQSALSGNVVNEQRKYAGVKPDDWQVQLAQLQKRRDDIQNEIAKLDDEARHNGVPSNALP